MRRKGIALALGMCISWALLQGGWAQQASPKAGNLSPELRGAIVQSMAKALDYLRKEQQPDGSWQQHPGLTSVVATSFLRSPDGLPAADTERINKALAFVVSFAKPDGGIS